MEKTSKILVLGSTGLLGDAISRKLASEQYYHVSCPSSASLNLLNKERVYDYFAMFRPEYVFYCAGKVGGIVANKSFPVEFFTKNMEMSINTIEACHKYGVKKTILLGSSCIYGKDCPQPMKEEYLMKGELEPTNEAYALAKLSMMRLGEYYNKEYGTNFITAHPCNVFGINDNFHKEHAHLIASVIRKVYEAKQNNVEAIEIWGDGTPIREHIYVDDVADALLFLINNYDSTTSINIGTGIGLTIQEIYEIIMQEMDYNGKIVFDKSKPNGTMKKVVDISKLTNLGWNFKTSFVEGIRKVIKHLEENNFTWKEK